MNWFECSTSWYIKDWLSIELVSNPEHCLDFISVTRWLKKKVGELVVGVIAASAFHLLHGLLPTSKHGQPSFLPWRFHHSSFIIHMGRRPATLTKHDECPAG